MIELKSLTKRFGNITAVDNLTLKAKKGEVIGFLGPNGAGKTTTMRLIVGYLKPSNGEIKVEGMNPLERRIEVVRQIGYLPENNPLYKDMLVGEYLSFVAEIKDDDNWREKVNSVGLSDKLDKKIEELSRGYKQRVGLVAALIGNPEILLLDEPTSGLDPIEQEKIRSLIQKVGRRKIVIFSTHILSEAQAVSTRIIIIDRGKIKYDGKKPKGIKTLENLFKKIVKG